MNNELLNKVIEALSPQFLKIINEKSKDEKKIINLKKLRFIYIGIRKIII